jgi:hypothetical protein
MEPLQAIGIPCVGRLGGIKRMIRPITTAAAIGVSQPIGRMSRALAREAVPLQEFRDEFTVARREPALYDHIV